MARKTQNQKSALEAKEFARDMIRARVWADIIKTTFSKEEEERCLRDLRQMKHKWGARYLP